jgi:hypothetical protein
MNFRAETRISGQERFAAQSPSAPDVEETAEAAQQKAIGILRARFKDEADSIVKELNARVEEYRKAEPKKADGS